MLAEWLQIYAATNSIGVGYCCLSMTPRLSKRRWHELDAVQPTIQKSLFAHNSTLKGVIRAKDWSAEHWKVEDTPPRLLNCKGCLQYNRTLLKLLFHICERHICIKPLTAQIAEKHRKRKCSLCSWLYEAHILPIIDKCHPDSATTKKWWKEPCNRCHYDKSRRGICFHEYLLKYLDCVST